MEPFTKRVVDIIGSIPKGKIMTYGQIAALAGSPRGARQVVRILHSLSEKHNLPWHRVINSKGEIGLRDYESQNTQRSILQSEGVKFSKQNKVDLNEFQFLGHAILEEPDFGF